MASEIDERIVQMKFDNAQFESGIRTSMQSLENFDKSLKRQDGSSALEALAGSVEKVSAKFSAMSVIATTALVNITNKAINAGERIIKSLSTDQISAGLNEYETKMGSVQTIMMGTGESLDNVMDKLEDLNTYADKTIYVFSDMTSNIGKFTNAGIKDLNLATTAMKGISNEAALAGASAAEASRAMYNIAQALGTGHMQLIDWKSIENANMATMEFKQSLIDTAKEMGVLNDASDVTAENFRDTLKDKWLTNKVLMGTLVKYADETTELGRKAFSAAQDIKTATQLFDTMKESVQSGWAITWEHIIGNFDQAKELFSGIGQVFDFFASRSADARNSVLKDWNELGGRTEIIQGLYNVFANVLMILKPIKEGFRDVFPPVTGKRLYEISAKFRQLTNTIWLSRDAAEGLRKVMHVLLIPLQVIKVALGGIVFTLQLLGIVGLASINYILGLISKLGSFGEILNKLVGRNGMFAIRRILYDINVAMAGSVQIIGNVIKSIKTLFGVIANSKPIQQLKNFFDSIFGNVTGGNILVSISKGFDSFANSISKVAQLKPEELILAFLTSIENGAIKVKEFILSFGGLKNAFKNAKSPFGELSFSLDGLKDKFAILGTYAKNFGEKLREATANITPAKVLIFGFGASITWLLINLAKAGHGIGEIFDNIGEAMEGLKFIVMAKAFNILSTALLKLSLAIIAVTTAVYLFRNAPVEDMVASAVVIAGIAAMFGIMIAKLGSKTTFDDGLTFAAMMMGIATGILAVTASLAILDKITFAEGFQNKLTFLAEALFAFGTITALVAAVAGKAKANLSGAVYIAAMGFAMNKVAQSLNEIDTLSVNMSMDSVKALGAVLLAIGAFCALTGKLKLTSIASLLIFCASYELIGKAIHGITSSIDTDKLDAVFNSIKQSLFSVKDFVSSLDDIDYARLMGIIAVIGVAGLGLFTGVAYAISNIGKGLIKIAVSTAIIMVSLNAIKKLDATQIQNGVSAISTILKHLMVMVGILGVFSTTVSGINSKFKGGGIKGFFEQVTGKNGFLQGGLVSLGNTASKIGSAVIKVSVAVGILVGVMKLMENMDRDKILGSTLAIDMLLVGLSGVIAACALARKAAPSIFALGLVVGSLVTAMALFTLIEVDEMKAASTGLLKGLGGLSLVVGATALVFKQLTNVNWKTALADLILLGGIVATVAGFGIYVKGMEGTDWESAKQAAVALGGFALAMAGAASLLTMGDWSGSAWYDGFLNVAQGLIAFAGVAGIMIGFATLFNEFAYGFTTIPFDKMMNSVVALGTFALSFAAVTVILSKSDFKDLKAVGRSLAGFVGVGASMLAFARFFKLFGRDFLSLDMTDMLKGAIGLGAFAVAFAGATDVLSLSAKNFEQMDDAFSSMLAFASVAASISIAILLMTPALIRLSAVNTAKLLGVAATISLLAIAMAGATVIIGFASKFTTAITGMIGAAIGIGAITVAMIGLAAALRIMGDSDPNKLFTLIGAMALMTITVGALGAILAYIPPVLLAFVAGIAAMAIIDVIFLGAAAAMWLFSKACEGISIAIERTTTSLSPFLQLLNSMDVGNIVGGLVGLAIAFTSVGLSSLLLIPAAASIGLFTIAVGALAIALGLFDAVITGSDLWNNLFNVGFDLIGKIGDGIIEAITGLYELGKAVIPEFAGGIAEYIELNPILENAGRAMAESILFGFSQGIGFGRGSKLFRLFIGGMADLGSEGGKAFNNGLDYATEDAFAEFEKQSSNTTNTVKANFISTAKVAKKSAEDTCNKFTATLVTNKTKIQNEAKYVFVDAVLEATTEAGEVAGESGNEISLNFFKNIIDSIKNGKTDEAVEKLKRALEDKLGKVLGNIAPDIPIQELFERFSEGGLGSIAEMLGIDLNLDEIKESLDFKKILDDMPAGIEAADGKASKLKDTAEKVTDSFKEMRDSIASSINIFDEFNEPDPYTADQLMKNIFSQIVGQQEWAHSFGELSAKGFEEGIISQLANAGTDSRKYISGLLDMTDAEVKRYNRMYLETQLIADSTIEEIKLALPTMSKALSEELETDEALLGHAEDFVSDIAKSSLKESLKFLKVGDNFANVTDATVTHIRKETQCLQVVGDICDSATISKEGIIEATEGLTEAVENENVVTVVEEANIYAVTDAIEDSVSAKDVLLALTEEAGGVVNRETDALEDNADALEKQSDALDLVADDQENFITITKRMVLEYVRALDAMDVAINEWKDDVRSSIDSSIKMYERFDFTYDLNVEDLITNMKTQHNALVYFGDTIEELTKRGLHQGIINDMIDKGVDGAFQYIAAFRDMTAEQIDEVNEVYESTMSLKESTVDRLAKDFQDAGYFTVAGFVNGIDGTKEEVAQALEAMSQFGLNALLEFFGIHSPSTLMAEKGMFLDQGMANGIRDNAGLVTAQMNIVARAVRDKANAIINFDEGYKIGSNMAEGLRAGITDKIDGIRDAAIAAAEAAVSAAKAALDIHSPSKVAYEIGAFFDRGMANGISEYASIVSDEASAMSNGAVDMMSNVVSHMVDYISDNVDSNPVIAPVLDLSNIQNGVKRANGLFTDGVSIGVEKASIVADSFNVRRSSSSDSISDISSQPQSGNTYNFTQNNYSPKALDRIEIYRQTKNQFSVMKGMG